MRHLTDKETMEVFVLICYVFSAVWIITGIVLAYRTSSKLPKLEKTIAALQTQIDDLKRELEEVKGRLEK